MDNDKLSDTLKTLTAQFQGCKETADQLQKENFELEYKNRELKTGQEAIEMKLKEAIDREKVSPQPFIFPAY